METVEKIVSFKQLRIWQKGMEIVRKIYQLSRKFPNEELYGLTSQMRRSAISIPSNIAEGFKRNHSKEYTQFLHIAQGSAAELETQLIISRELGFTSEKESEDISEALDHLSKMITVLLKKIKQ